MKKFLLMCFSFGFVLSVWAQDRVVTGKLTSKEDGSVLPGVNVVLKGTTTGTVTDAEGAYKISVPTADGTLVFSFIGLETVEVAVGERSVVDAQLGSDVKQLSEVVVTGSGVATDKKKLAIAVQSITADKLPQTPTASIDQALVGKIPGAQISSVDGTPGARVSILLRGINTVQRGTQPMILVDGAEMGVTDISQLNLSNVERVEVVQGAASASLYGAQGANGVIQIFTKKGKKGRVNVDVSSAYSVNSYINTGNVHKATLHSWATDASNNVLNTVTGKPLTVQDDGTYYDSNNGTGVQWAYLADPANGFPTAMSNPQNIYNKKYDQNLKYYDHFKQLFQQGYTATNTINISGAGDKSDYSISLQNNKQESNIKQNGYVDRTNVSVNVGGELFKGFKVRSNTQLIYTKNTLHPNYGTQRNNIYNMLNISPFYDLTRKLADGNNWDYSYAGTVSVNGFNPFYDFQYSSGLENTVDVIQNFNVNYNVNKFLEFDGKYTINFESDQTKYVFQNQSANLNAQNWGPQLSATGLYNANDIKGELDRFEYTASSQNLLLSAFVRTDFQNDFHSKLPITTSTQISYDYRRKKNDQFGTYGLGLQTYPIYTLSQTGSQAVPYDNSSDFVTYGYLVNQKIDYADVAGVSGGIRSDYSSAFGKGSAPFTFPHVGGFVRPSQLNFWSGSSLANIFPEFKIRAAYGEAGIQPLAYDRLNVVGTQNVGANFAAYPNKGFRNLNLGVEVSKEFEVGVDFGFKLSEGSWFSGINAAITSWSRKSENVIYNVSAPLSSGGSTNKDNAIFMSSSGTEFQLNINVLKTNDLTWDFTTNFGHQSSQIDRINGAPIVIGFSGGSTTLVLKAGEKIGQLYGYKAFTSTGQIDQVTGQPYITPGTEGNYEKVDGRIVDKKTKAIQFTLDKYSFGDPNPKFNSAFINSFTYKNFLTFGVQFDYINKSHIYNQTKEWMYRDGISGDYDQPVTIDGTKAAYTAYYRSVYAAEFGNLNGDRNATKDYFYEDATFLRLRNVSLGFDFAKALKLKGFNKLQLVLSGRNLATWTKYTGFDPEINSGSTNSAYERGIDHNSMPNVKSYQVSVNLGF
ncbi:MAG: SusC/RagA family TonB-linked outer membrane protein [Bacteroidetes bacterium]|nr:SusC/RagA family TonB-linked outer membrane protein [Bacteroidota bacterium]